MRRVSFDRVCFCFCFVLLDRVDFAAQSLVSSSLEEPGVRTVEHFNMFFTSYTVKSLNTRVDHYFLNH